GGDGYGVGLPTVFHAASLDAPGCLVRFCLRDAGYGAGGDLAGAAMEPAAAVHPGPAVVVVAAGAGDSQFVGLCRDDGCQPAAANGTVRHSQLCRAGAAVSGGAAVSRRAVQQRAMADLSANLAGGGFGRLG